MTYKWAALVYGRTYSVDFRFLALPEDFKPADQKWVERYILATTREPEKLAEAPRWALFLNDQYCVVGVACMACDLIGPQEPGPDDFTRDEKGRPLYLFAAYVTKRDSEGRFPPLPPVGENLETFRPLYEKVRTRWKDKSYDDPDPASVYESVAALSKLTPTESQSPAIKELNENRDQITLWPEKEGAMVWLAAVAHAQQVPVGSVLEREMSVCLGLPNRRKAIESPFLNGTTSDIQQKIQIARAVQSKSSSDPVANASKKQAKPAAETPSSTPSSLPRQNTLADVVDEVVGKIITTFFSIE